MTIIKLILNYTLWIHLNKHHHFVDLKILATNKPEMLNRIEDNAPLPYALWLSCHIIYYMTLYIIKRNQFVTFQVSTLLKYFLKLSQYDFYSYFHLITKSVVLYLSLLHLIYLILKTKMYTIFYAEIYIVCTNICHKNLSDNMHYFVLKHF